tara:strand:+ start:621 stop:839 length:219 start_codon:yes stop_codon:yes gene_type:complete
MYYKVLATAVSIAAIIPLLPVALEAHNFNMCVNESIEEKYMVQSGYVIDKSFKAVHLCNGGSFLVNDAQSDD